MRQSLTGLLLRLRGAPAQMYVVREFLRNFRTAKESFEKGNLEDVKELFSYYVVEYLPDEK